MTYLVKKRKMRTLDFKSDLFIHKRVNIKACKRDF